MKETNSHTHDSRGQANPFTVPLLNITQRNAEHKLLCLLELGNPAFLAAQMEACIHKPHADAIAALADSSMTQAKYQGIAFTNLARRTALTAGVSENQARAIAETFTTHYAAMTDPVSQWVIAQDMLLSFCSAIRDASLESYSPVVRQCCVYIDENLFADISLADLGDLTGLSSHYVSDLFRREIGMGALQYIHLVRLLHAKYLLEHSSLNITALAELLSYPSHSNFSQQFKKNYGITPTEYRALCAK